MRTTLARQLRRHQSGNFSLIVLQEFEKIPFTHVLLVTEEKEIIARVWREAHPRKPKQKPTKEHRRSKNRRSK